MSEGTAGTAARRSGSGFARLGRAGRALPPDRRLAAIAAAGLFLTLFLPWYQETGIVPGPKTLQTTTGSLTGWAAFSWVEAAVLLVAVSVLALLFLRAEGRAFHLPGGDGFIVMVAGGWTCLLVIWRIFDKQGVTKTGQFANTAGIEWGIFVALAGAGLLTYAGTRIRAAHQPEPLLPGEEPAGTGPSGSAPTGPAGSAPTPRASTSSRRPLRGAGAEPAAAAGTPPPAPQAVRADPTGTREPQRTSRPRRANWAEPVTWEEPPTPPAPSGAGVDLATTGLETPHDGDPTGVLPTHSGEDPTRVIEPAPTEVIEPAVTKRPQSTQLRILLDDERLD